MLEEGLAVETRWTHVPPAIEDDGGFLGLYLEDYNIAPPAFVADRRDNAPDVGRLVPLAQPALAAFLNNQTARRSMDQPLMGNSVVYRKGELSKGTIDRRGPHQVALRADRCTGTNGVAIRNFCKGLSLCPRGHSFYHDKIDFNVYCFAELEHATLFCARFDGETIDPKDRPSWPKRR